MKIKIINKNEYSSKDLQYFKEMLGQHYYAASDVTIISHYYTKKYISNLLNKRFDEIIFHKNKHGKPYCDFDIHFNISHSDKYIAIAFSNKEVGIDIENKRSINPKLFSKCFNECDSVFIDKNNFDTSFLKIWTIKEAYFKFLGTGITSLKAVNINDINSNYYVKQTETDNYILSIVTFK